MAKDMTRMSGTKNAALLLGSKQHACELNPVVSRRFTEETAGVCWLIVTQRVSKGWDASAHVEATLRIPRSLSLPAPPTEGCWNTRDA